MKKLLGILFCLFAPFTISAMSMPAGKVLLVHSYHTGYVWTDGITAGVKKGLKGAGVQLEVFYMDTKRKTGEGWKKRAGELAKEKVAEFRPDIVIAADDNAQTYFAKDYAGRPSPQFVFCGVNAEASKYGYPSSNITGILERPFFLKSLGLLRQIRPNVRTIAVITDDGPTSNAILAYIRKLESPLKIVSIDQPPTFLEWQTLIEKYQEIADAIAIIAYQTVKQSKGAESMDSGEVMAWTMENNTKPTVGFLDFAMRDGVLCGVAESAEEHGLLSAEIAKEILRGKKAGDFPIKKAVKGTAMINLKTARKLGIAIPAHILKTAEQITE